METLLCQMQYLQQYRHKTIKEFVNNDLQSFVTCISYIHLRVDAMRTLKGFISSKILHLCFYSLGQQFYMLDLLQLQEPGVNYICYRSPADIRCSWPVKTSRWSRWVQEVDLQVLLHSVNLLNNTNLLLLIVSACDILVQTQGLCGHPTKTCLSGNVK